MGDARDRSGHFAWCTCGITALGAHLLLLWTVPSAQQERTLAASTERVLEVEIAAERQAPSAEQAHAVSGPVEAEAPAAIPRAKRRPLRAATASLPEASAAPSSDAARRGNALASGETASSAHPGTHAAGEKHGTQAGELAMPTAGGPSQSGEQVALGGGGNAAGVGALKQGPRLLATHDPCAGYFPGTAAVKRGQVQLSIDVDAQGHPHPSQTLLELPRGQGFEHAAKACASQLHFAPALDAHGHPVSARARIALRFERS